MINPHGTPAGPPPGRFRDPLSRVQEAVTAEMVPMGLHPLGSCSGLAAVGAGAPGCRLRAVGGLCSGEGEGQTRPLSHVAMPGVPISPVLRGTGMKWPQPRPSAASHTRPQPGELGRATRPTREVFGGTVPGVGCRPRGLGAPGVRFPALQGAGSARGVSEPWPGERVNASGHGRQQGRYRPGAALSSSWPQFPRL